MKTPIFVLTLALLCVCVFSPPVQSQITEEEILALIAANDLVLARERAQEMRRASPTSAFAAYYGAVLQDDADAAASSFLDFVKRFEDSAYMDRALYRLGQYYFARSNFKRSRQYFVEVANRYANSALAPAAQYQAAKALLLSGDLYGAKTELENISRRHLGTWMAKFAQEDLQQEALKSLPPRIEEKTPPKIAEQVVAQPPAAETKKPEREPAPQTVVASNQQTKKTAAQPQAAPPQEENKTSPQRKVEPSAKKALPKPKPAALYAVQVGAYLQRTNAEDQRKRYAQAGYKTEVVEKQEGKRKYYAVWVGELTTRDQAYALSDELKKRFKVRAHTVRRDE